MHKSGFVNIIGKPNVGKSTLMNALVGERMSIITNKPQTTRHRIIGIISGEDHQIVFSDTPGIIETPSYKMQQMMNNFVNTSFEDADLVLFVTEKDEKYRADDPIIEKLKAVEVPLFLVINKVDLAKPEEIVERIQFWNNLVSFSETIPISALKKENTETLFELIKKIPAGRPSILSKRSTDRPARAFFY